jgi:LacI family transcriptional regulator
MARSEIEVLLQRPVDGVLYTAMSHRVLRVPERLRSVLKVVLDASLHLIGAPRSA